MAEERIRRRIAAIGRQFDPRPDYSPKSLHFAFARAVAPSDGHKQDWESEDVKGPRLDLPPLDLSVAFPQASPASKFPPCGDTSKDGSKNQSSTSPLSDSAKHLCLHTP